MSRSERWSRPRILLALLLVALVAGAVPVRAPARGEKSSGTSAWRAATARPLAPRPDLDLRGFPPLPADAPELLPVVTFARADAPRPSRGAVPAPPAERSPLPRAPPLA